jgi:hypothetical protein
MPKKQKPTPKTKSKTFYVTTRTVVVKRYEVLAPTAKQALVPIETLVKCWPCRLMEASTTIYNVADKRAVDSKLRKEFTASMSRSIALREAMRKLK